MKVLDKILTEILLQQAIDFKPQMVLSFDSLEMSLGFLIEENKLQEAIQLLLNHSGKFLHSRLRKIDSVMELSQEFFDVSNKTVKELDSRFKEHCTQKQHIASFGNWFRKQMNEVIEKVILKDQNTAEQKLEQLNELLIYSYEYDVEGLGVDFLIKEKISKIQFDLKGESN